MKSSRKGKTSTHLRDAIDKGRTGDKVPAPDPAAAPLGTDDEAAGFPPDPDRVRLAMSQEVREEGGADEGRTGGGRSMLVLGALVSAAVAVVLVAVWLA